MAMKLKDVLGDPLPKLIEEKHFRTAYLILVVTTVAATLLSVIFQNREFFFYSVLSTASLFLFFRARKRMNLHWETIALVAGLVFLNFLGGNFLIEGTRLYDQFILGMRFDQFMHFAGFGVVAFATYDFLVPHLKPVKKRYFLTMAILIALGAAAVIEIFEFGAVIVFSGATAVGDYFNNAADLVFGLLGAISGSIFADVVFKKKKVKNAKL